MLKASASLKAITTAAMGIFLLSNVACSKDITVTQYGKAIGYFLVDDKREIWNEDVKVNVKGMGVTEKSAYHNVTGLYLLDGGQLTVNGNLTLTLENKAPATRGLSPGADIAHYYMSGVYAGYGGITDDGVHGNTVFRLNGNAVMDVVGVACQANKDGYIALNGAVNIVTHPLETSDTYGLLAEEGSIFVNMDTSEIFSEDGIVGGTRIVALEHPVQIYGNLGIINKNYGIDPNPGNHGSYIYLSLSSPESQLVGGVLNEFEESANNPYQSGVSLFLRQGGLWENKWLGSERRQAVIKRDAKESYLYKGSKVAHIIGGDKNRPGFIRQNDSRSITVDNLQDAVTVLYSCGAETNKVNGGDIIIKKAKNAYLRLLVEVNDDAVVDEILNDLAEKLVYEGHQTDSGHLQATAEICRIIEGKTRIIKSADIEFAHDGRGQMKS